MSEKSGHFENGRWVLDPEPAPEPAPAPEQEAPPESADAATPPSPPTTKELASQTSQSVRKAVDDVVGLGQHLLATPQGHDEIERAARQAAADLERAINEWARSAREALKKR